VIVEKLQIDYSFLDDSVDMISTMWYCSTVWHGHDEDVSGLRGEYCNT
jgi:hypothetical protein